MNSCFPSLHGFFAQNWVIKKKKGLNKKRSSPKLIKKKKINKSSSPKFRIRTHADFSGPLFSSTEAGLPEAHGPWSHCTFLPPLSVALSEATVTPSTSLSANTPGAPGYLNLFAPSRPNLNLFLKGKNSRCFRPVWFRTHTRTNR